MWMEEGCKGQRELHRKHDEYDLHKRIKEMAGSVRQKAPYILKSADGMRISDANGKKIDWSKYIAELFDDDRQDETGKRIDGTGPSTDCLLLIRRLCSER